MFVALLAAAIAASVISVEAKVGFKRIAAPGPLNDYVHRDDGAFSWTEYNLSFQPTHTTHYLNMTSQRWYDETFTSQPLWWHYLVIHVPNVVRYPDSGFLFVGEGSNTDQPPQNTDGRVFRTGQYAAATGIVTALLLQVPNQPIVFEGDGFGRFEDDLVAWTWRRFHDDFEAGRADPEVLAYMPMTKAAVKAMDAVQEFVKERNGVDIEEFMISGQSKRGWTIWLTAAVDERVIALSPAVLSCLNNIENTHHYWRAYGGWPYAMIDYWRFSLMGELDTPGSYEMFKHIDPYSYREYLTMPKLMISSSSDEFFSLDDYDYFYDELVGEKHLWFLENTGHFIEGGPLGEQYWSMLQTFYLSILQGHQKPSLDWARFHTESGGSIIVLSPTPPLSISAWSAPSIAQNITPNRRDWRMSFLSDSGIQPSNIVWTQSAVENLGSGYYQAAFDNPTTGYLSFFIKMTFAGPEGRTYYFTTEANIIPNTWPYEDCVGLGCTGGLI